MGFSSKFNIVIVCLLILDIKQIYGIGQMYISSSGNTYYIDLEHKHNWFESQIACSKLNMTLVNINTQKKAPEIGRIVIEDLKQNIEDLNANFWIGGVQKPLPNHHMLWLASGEKYVFNSKFGHKPDFQDSNEYCVELRLSENWRWRDNSCEQKNGFICENSSNENVQLEKPKSKTHKELEDQLKMEIEKNDIMQKELKNEQEKQFEYKEQIQKLKDQQLEMQERLIKNLQDKLDLKDELKTQLDLQNQLKIQIQNLKEQNTKLENDLQAEILKRENH